MGVRVLLIAGLLTSFGWWLGQRNIVEPLLDQNGYVGDSCDRVYVCTAKNSHCQEPGPQICVCNDGYREVNKTWCGKFLGDDCVNDTDCNELIRNSLCDPVNRTCACQHDYTKFGSYECDVGIGNHCQKDGKETCSYNTNTTICKGGICCCADYDHYIPTTDSTTCGEKIYEVDNKVLCLDSVQCMVTNSECRNNRCQCKPEFTQFNNTFCGKSIGDLCETCNDLEHTVCEGRCEPNNTRSASRESFIRYRTPSLEPIWTLSEENDTCEPEYMYVHRCACDNMTVASVNRSTCLPIVTEMYSNCSEILQCRATWKQSLCSNGICICKPLYVYVGDDCYYRISEIGGDCKYSEQCIVPNSECSEGKCECKQHYTEGLNTCLAYLDGECTSEVDCPVVNSACLNGRCACEEGYTALNDTFCGRGIGDKCDAISDPCGNFSASSCKSNICQCDSGYVSNIARNRCLPISTAINSTCEESQQCTARWGEKASCLNKMCQCKEGFVNDDTSCIATVSELGTPCSAVGQCVVEGAVCDEDTKTCRCGNTLTEFNTSYCGAAVNDACAKHDCDAVESICSHGVCICKNGFIVTKNETMCLRLSDVGESCSDVVQCSGSLGKGASCENNVCSCLDGYKYYEKKCTSYVSKLNEKCDEKTQVCYLEKSDGFDRTQCRNGICQCKPGFSASIDNLSCNSSAILKGTTFWITCSLILTFWHLKWR